ncbi:MAG: hypothetical protein OER12_01200 [Acidimicrobiia bacterium]|nr:hypothetical protein [Acidimicrobiia bacterium]
MARARRTWIIGAVAISMLAATAIASADDSVVNIGYDEENRMLLLNTSPADSTFDCTLQGSEVVAGYATSDDGVVTVETLQTKDDEALEAFMFLNRPFEKVDTEEFDTADAPAPYAGPDGECGLSAGVVAGPNGQVNHGQLMKAFHQLFDMRGKGCVNRLLAQSDLGKGDQQVKTGDVDPEFAAGESGTLEFLSFTVDCEHGKKEKSDDHPSQQGKEKSDSPGKSGQAKGRNK